MSSKTGSIVGHVIDAEGNSVSGATVAFAGGTAPHRDIAGITTAEGAFRFGGVQLGSYDLEARKDTATGRAHVVVSEASPTNVEIQIG